MRIYLAARYSRRVELCGYREQLQAMGHTVTSRWLNGDHQISDDGKPLRDSGEAIVEGDSGDTSQRAADLRAHFAKEDIADVMSADCLIAFTEPPRSNASRGGRHVELGIALGQRKPAIVVGYRENIFCWLPWVQFREDWAAVLREFGHVCHARRLPELGVIHADGGYPMHVPQYSLIGEEVA